jgi:DNA-binding response OmpR family regulator
MFSKYFNSKFIDYKKVLVVEKDEYVSFKIKSSLLNKIKNMEIISSLSEVINLNDYDLIIIDIDYYNMISLSSILSKIEEKTSVIFLTSNFSEDILEFTHTNTIKNIILKSSQLETLYIYVYLILKEKSKINLGNNFFYCLQSNLVFLKNQEISLTKLESKLLKSLIINKNKVLTYNEIKSLVWEGRNCSIFSLRNIIKKIRDKTHQKVIKNISNNGYRINIIQF